MIHKNSLWLGRFQWTWPGSGNQNRLCGFYRWQHPTQYERCQYLGVFAFGRELRWWHIDKATTPHPDEAGYVPWQDRPPRNWNVQLEWKVQDVWIGAFWKRTGGSMDVWVCLLPCLPLHVSWWSGSDDESALSAPSPASEKGGEA